MAVACNNLDEAQTVQLRLRTLGIADDRAIVLRLRTADCGFDSRVSEVGQVSNGVLAIRIPAKSAHVLCPK